MGSAAPSGLAAWHDFYELLGAAAATLVGLTFVTASISAGIIKREHEQAVNIFISPTALHFTAILVACFLVLAPITDQQQSVLLIAEGAAAGLYSTVVLIRMHRHGYAAEVDLRDRLWYALSPIAAYVVVAIGALLLLQNRSSGASVLAAGLGLLLLAGIRNAWDMVVWMMMRKG